MMMYQMVCLWCLQVRQCGPCSPVMFVLSLFTFATHFCTASSVHFTSVQSSGNFGSSIFGSGSASDRQPWRHAAGLSHRDSPPARSASSSLTTLISTRRRLHTRTRIQQHALTAARREWHAWLHASRLASRHGSTHGCTHDDTADAVRSELFAHTRCAGGALLSVRLADQDHQEDQA